MHRCVHAATVVRHPPCPLDRSIHQAMPEPVRRQAYGTNSAAVEPLDPALEQGRLAADAMFLEPVDGPLTGS